MDFSLIIPAFIAGIFTFLAPCTFPLVPAYLAFISGILVQDLQDPLKSRYARIKIFLNGFFFILGFSAIFIILGTAAGLFGQILFQYRVWISRIGGIFVIFFGFFMLNVIKIPFLSQEIRLKTPDLFQQGNPINSFILGATFGLGWTPCLGPILGSILTLAASYATVWQGAFLLSIFSLGLAIPFLVIAAGISSASLYIKRLDKYLNAISVLGGVLLILLGILILTDRLDIWTVYFYHFFKFINYDRLLDYL